MKQNINFLQLLISILLLLGTLFTTYVVITNKVTALETTVKQQENINNRIENKLDNIYNILISKK